MGLSDRYGRAVGLLLALALAAPLRGVGQAPTRVTVSGYLRDATSGESLIGALLYFPLL